MKMTRLRRSNTECWEKRQASQETTVCWDFKLSEDWWI